MPWLETWDYKRVSPDSPHVAAFACGPRHICIGVPVDDTAILQPDAETMGRVFEEARLISALPEMLAENKRLRSALQTIRNALNAHNRPDTPLPNSQRKRLRDIADLALE